MSSIQPTFSNTRDILATAIEIFNSSRVEFWLEGGTALAAYRDGKIFPWEHDIDFGVWYSDLDKIKEAVDKFIEKGCKVWVQKDLPYIDNIIQIYFPDNPNGVKPSPNQIDIYLYHRKNGYALMRWIHNPEGKYIKLQKEIFWLFLVPVSILQRTQINIKSIKDIFAHFIPFRLKKELFKFVLYIFFKFGRCIYHVHPEKYFDELKTIDFYGLPFLIPKETEAFLEHRYGPDWKNPNSKHNSGFYTLRKWKKISARRQLKMSYLDFPDLDFSLQDKYLGALRD